MRPLHALFAAALAFGSGATAVAQLSIVNDLPGSYIDISGTGTPLGIAGDDEATIFTTISNGVFPAGAVIVGNNGGAGFGSPPDDNLGPVNEPLPSVNAFGGGQSLLPFWDDIGNTIGDVYWQELSDRLIVQWEMKQFEDSTDTVTFQLQVIAPAPGPVQIYAQLLYRDVEQPRALGGISATIGYQDGIGGIFNDVQWSFNQQFAVRNGTILSLIPEPGTAALLAAGGLCALRRHRVRRG